MKPTSTKERWRAFYRLVRVAQPAMKHYGNMGERFKKFDAEARAREERSRRNGV